MTNQELESSNPIKRLLSGAIQYSIAGILARGLTLVSVPLYLTYLTADEFGIQSIAVLNELILMILAGYAIVNAMGRFYSETLRTGEGQGAVVGSAMIGLVATSVIFIILWQIFVVPIAHVTLDTRPENILITRLVGISFVATIFFDLALAVWQLDQQIIAYASGYIIKSAASLGLGLLFVAVFDMGPLGVVLGMTLASLLTGAFSVIWLVRRFDLRYEWDMLKRMGRYGLPLVPAAIITVGMNGADRYLLKTLDSFEAAGVFSVIYMLANAANMVFINPFKQIWTPTMWRMRLREDEKDFHRRTMVYFTAFQFYIITGLVVYGDLAVDILSRGKIEFTMVALAAPLLYLGFTFYGAYEIFSAGYFFENQTHFYTITVIVATTASIVLNVLLIPLLGVWGSAIAFCFSYFVLALLSYIFGRRFFRVDHNWGRILKAILINAGLAAAALIARQIGSYWVGIAAAVPIVASYPWLMLLLFFSQEERQMARNYLVRFNPTLARFIPGS
jgi:O-antigen/teichoic acid export membrane protein